MNKNGNEVADELAQLIQPPSMIYDGWAKDIISNAYSMLRQQQEKIATWEESFYNSVAENGKLRETIRQQKAEIAILRKEQKK